MLKNAPKSSCIIMILDVSELYFSQVSYKETLNLILHLMFLLLFTVKEFKL